MKILKVLICLFFCGFFFNCEKIEQIYEWKNHFKTQNLPKKVKKYSIIGNYSKTPIVNFILDHKDKLSVEYLKHITKISDYTKIPLGFTLLTSWNSIGAVPKTCKVIVIKNSAKLEQKGINALLAFVAKGGTLYLLETTEDIRLGYLLGIKPRSNYEVDTKAKGIYFEKNVLPGVSGVRIKPKEVHFGLRADNFSPEVNILAWADSDRKYPFFLENKIGAGKVVFFNSTKYFEKEDRGLLFAGILDGLRAVPYPVANTSTIFLDDFPSPSYEVKKEPIKSEMNKTITDFVYSVWWPDMKKIAKQFNIKYTALLTFDYRNKINPPFSFSQWDASLKTVNGREFIVPHWMVNDLDKYGFEKGFHGYNHVSLLKRGWPYSSAIMSSMKATKKKWKVNSYGVLPVSYVPPSNDIDQYGLKYLKLSMPSIKYMCSLYLGELKDGGDREFDFDPYNKELFDYPRISYGYDMTDNIYATKSLFLYTGIWNHFVHPDDVYQIPENMDKGITKAELRNPKALGWRKTKGSSTSFLKLFVDYLSANKEQFPLMQYTTVAHAVPQVMQWRAAKFIHTARANTYSVAIKSNPKTNASKFKTSWFVYFEKQDYNQAEAQIKKQTQLYSHTPFLNGRLYHIITTKQGLNFKSFYNSKAVPDLKQIQKEYDEYVKDQKLFMEGAFDPQGEDYDLKLKLEKQKLLANMFSNPIIDYAIWDKYAYYESWDGDGDAVWELLKKHCEKYPSTHNVMYSKNLEKIFGYATQDLQNYWIKMQYKYNPDNLSILKEYLSIITDTDNVLEIEKVLKRIYELEPIQKNLQDYLAYLLLHNKEEAHKMLENIAPNRTFDQLLVADICWLYASVNDIQRAYNWSTYTDLVSFSSKLTWMYELSMYEELVKSYLEYAVFCPEDLEVKITMVSLYHGMGQFKNAWNLACNLPVGEEKTKLIQMLNTDVVYLNESLQDQLLKESPQCFTAQALAIIKDNRRQLYGDFITTNTEYSTFSDTKISLINSVGYNRFDKKKNLHTLKVTNKKLYAFSPDDLPSGLIDPDNKDLMVHGLNYNFRSNTIKKKRDLNYSGGIGVEVNSDSRLYYNLRIEAEFNKDYKSRSVLLQYTPVNTSPAYTKNIYVLKSIFYDNSYVNVFGIESSLELEYYNNPVVYNLMFNSKARLKPNRQKWFRSSPILEVGVLKSNADTDIFYPFFVFKEMYYGGLGGGIYLGKEEDKFKFSTEATYLSDSKYNKFYNVRGNVEYSFGKFLSMNALFDVFFQNQYQSSTAQLGMKYIF